MGYDIDIDAGLLEIGKFLTSTLEVIGQREALAGWMVRPSEEILAEAEGEVDSRLRLLAEVITNRLGLRLS